ncbi:hypothetical protein [Rubellicoccus peritrichatus]|uniref:Uncharacterized protein n=1 Tax=Rubellicoccus peritrichatus TaxID=3080537 RepID=A0AAQ3QQA1_9BACT|nr:hypothetical protein [Puniceicoccus sp. CR14]WOO40028.1 hypothetical protein RZN69_15500 [Puniceicoccus sp. CR14]
MKKTTYDKRKKDIIAKRPYRKVTGGHRRRLARNLQAFRGFGLFYFIFKI